MSRNSKEVTQLLIQEATIKLFSQKNYNDITMEEIAIKSAISKRTLYKYFPSKASIFTSIFERFLVRILVESASNDISEYNYVQTLQEGLKYLYSFTEAHMDFMRLFWTMGEDSLNDGIPVELVSRIKALNESIIEASAKKLQKKEPTGIFRKIDPILANHIVSAINKGIFFQTTKETNMGIDTLDRQDLLDGFLGLIEAGGKE